MPLYKLRSYKVCALLVLGSLGSFFVGFSSSFCHRWLSLESEESSLVLSGGTCEILTDPGQDDATMAEPDDSSTKDKPGWTNGEHTDLKPAGETDDELKQSVDELDPAEESMHELKPAEVRVDELDELGELSDTTLELDELSDTTLELSELSDTEDGAGLAVGRNGPCSAQGKVHKKCNTESTKKFGSWVALTSSKSSQNSTSRFYKSL
uniref:Uncharacterized protein n=1 Tax=Brassica campestris TaxID=3711 RepID=M4ENT3_BRACM